MEQFGSVLLSVFLSLLLPLDVSWVLQKKFQKTCAGFILPSKLGECGNILPTVCVSGRFSFRSEIILHIMELKLKLLNRSVIAVSTFIVFVQQNQILNI